MSFREGHIVSVAVTKAEQYRRRDHDMRQAVEGLPSAATVRMFSRVVIIAIFISGFLAGGISLIP